VGGATTNLNWALVCSYCILSRHLKLIIEVATVYLWVRNLIGSVNNS